MNNSHSIPMHIIRLRKDAQPLTSDAKESNGDSVPEVRIMERAVDVMVLKAVAGLRDQRQNCTTHPVSSWLSSSWILSWAHQQPGFQVL
jgi:hypothetical protein